MERETGEEGRERKLERGDYFFWLYILVDNIYIILMSKIGK